MKVLVTGHMGYIGSVMVPFFQAAGHEVVGLDSGYFDGCDFGDGPASIPELRVDVRDVRAADLEGFDAVVHLAGLSNDPVGNLDPNVTYAINFTGSLRLAAAAKEAGVRRFVFASSCSIYGAAGEGAKDETSTFNPVTAYAESKVWVERGLAAFEDERFCPVYMRNATVHGASPRLRGDLVVHYLVGTAIASGEVLIKSDGTPWRPLVHVEDVSRAFLAALEAPEDLVRGQAFNIGADSQNFQVSDVAAIVEAIVPNSKVTYAPGGEPDLRSYQVDFSKFAHTLPNAVPQWTLERSVKDLYDAYRRNELNIDDLLGPRHTRLLRIEQLKNEGRLSDDLRWIGEASAVRAPLAS
ncbi:MAG: NAD-dependent epimerase/dehydratase family protein [Dehalococcoidia bacterium]